MLFLLACATPEDSAVTDSSDLTVSLAPPAQGYQLVTDPYEVPAFSEVEVCSVVKLEPKGDEQLAWIGNMESLSSTGTHHMNVIIGQFSFLDGFLGEGAAEEALGAPLGAFIVHRIGRESTLVVVSILCVAQFIWTMYNEWARLQVWGLFAALLGVLLFNLFFQRLHQIGDRLERRQKATPPQGG